MKNIILGALFAYTVCVSAYAYALHTGKVASTTQASVVSEDLISQLQGAR